MYYDEHSTWFHILKQTTLFLKLIDKRFVLCSFRIFFLIYFDVLQLYRWIKTNLDWIKEPSYVCEAIHNSPVNFFQSHFENFCLVHKNGGTNENKSMMNIMFRFFE